ncbi:SDR family NAD(P)-dependent oxidoreductase [bacterium]|nr:SDR family NAD(P)-dependent oxidoreductase [bacterium]
MSKKVYVITGGTSGIGLAFLKRLTSDSLVFLAYRNEAKLPSFDEFDAKIIPFYLDYSKSDTIKPAIDFVKSRCTKIDMLLNGAGCVVAGPIEKISIDELRRQFEVNVFGHLELTQGLIDYLENGKIINISSMSSFGVFPFIAPYSASKRCLDMFFNSLLLETKQNVKVISIKPGVIATPLWNKSIDENLKYIQNCDGYEKEMEYLIKNAKRHTDDGLNVDKVVDLILKIEKNPNPKLSYLIGRDAIFASYFAKLPQKILNKLIKFGLKLKIK